MLRSDGRVSFCVLPLGTMDRTSIRLYRSWVIILLYTPIRAEIDLIRERLVLPEVLLPELQHRGLGYPLVSGT